jgi:hypothetical protein
LARLRLRFQAALTLTQCLPGITFTEVGGVGDFFRLIDKLIVPNSFKLLGIADDSA